MGSIRYGRRRSEFVFDQPLQTALRYKLPAEALGRDPRHFLRPAAGLSGDGDQRHRLLSYQQQTKLPMHGREVVIGVVIGVDIGGTKIAAARVHVTEEPVVAQSTVLPTRAWEGLDRSLGQVFEAIEQVIDS